MLKFDFLVYIGRFQPFHRGHEHVIYEALRRAKNVIVCVGSARAPRTLRNPWTYDERVDMISTALLSAGYPKAMENRVHTVPIQDFAYNDDEWVMIRASGTEPVLRNYAQSSTQQNAFMILKAAEDTLLNPAK